MVIACLQGPGMSIMERGTHSSMRTHTFFPYSDEQRTLKVIKSDSKDIYDVSKDYISIKCVSFELSIYQKRNYTNVFNIDIINVS